MIRLQVTHPLLTSSGPRIFSVELNIIAGEFVAVTGPSGSGKTTLLRVLAGLLRPKQGTLYFGDSCWVDTSRQLFVRPQDREVGIVFQDYALFPHMTVRRNLTYALPRGGDPQIVEELMQSMELEGLTDRYPRQLSGGQQQRVALARALVRKPALLLLDEPLSAVDYELRLRLQQYIQEVHERFHLTTILVSHNPQEVHRLANRYLRLEEGSVVRQGATGGGSMLTLQATLIKLLPQENDALPAAEIQAGENLLVAFLSPGFNPDRFPMPVTIHWDGASWWVE